MQYLFYIYVEFIHPVNLSRNMWWIVKEYAEMCLDLKLHMHISLPPVELL